MLTYKEARDKIWNAYFRDEIQPFSLNFCFCGNLDDNKGWWFSKENDDNKYYSVRQYKKMENALFDGMNFVHPEATKGAWPEIKNTEVGENALFTGMLWALDVLKEIHRSRGENVDDLPVLTKRILQTS